MHKQVIPYMDLGHIAASGQCFRMNPLPSGAYQVIAGDRQVTITPEGRDTFIFDCGKDIFDSLWHPYFDIGTDYASLASLVPKEDHFLQASLAYARGLRILRQDPWETLISFILSQRKSIPAIKGCVENLCAGFGAPLPDGGFAFPAPHALALANEGALQACGLGYRTRYVQGTARMVAEGQVDLEALRLLSDGELQEQLCRFPGVGVKVAQCVMLFAYARFNAFPRDVWILRVEQNEYHGRFPEENYPGTAGILQQYMFYFGKSKEYILWKEQHGQAGI